MKAPEDIFVNDNVIMVCDECLTSPKDNVSPKRKQPNTTVNLVQRTIDVQSPTLSLSKTVSALITPSKNNTVKQNQQMHTVVESLVHKIEIQTATIAELKASVDTMNDTVHQQKVTVGESIKANNENISSIKKTLSLTPRFNSKKSYAEAAKEGFNSETVTPKSSRPKQTPRSNKPVLTGTSTNVIGKQISPNQIKRNDRAAVSKPEKAIWVSRIHRETTEEELTSYIKNSIGIATPDITVRKLVKKDRDISTYSFVSFRITCSPSNFATLMDPTYWPSNSQLREFDLNRKSSMGVRLNRESTDNNSEPKNEEPITTDPMEVENDKVKSQVTSEQQQHLSIPKTLLDLTTIVK